MADQAPMPPQATSMRRLKWLYPGMKVKRWISLCALGLIMVGAGSVKALAHEGSLVTIGGVTIWLVGVGLVITGMKKMVKSLITVFIPQRETDLVEIVYRQRQLERGPKIVVIGGGTGLSVLLHGLKEYTSHLSAVVTVADDGGSSGRLREDFDMPAPGDIRNCLVALADAEPLMRQLFQYRFDESSALKGHSFGNLFITAMTRITGDFEAAVRESSKVLAIRGRVIPSTCAPVRLIAQHADGTLTYGESRIGATARPIQKVMLDPPDCAPTREALEALRDADAIILGPGSLYTSVIPNLLVPGVIDIIQRSKALTMYVCNVMTQSRETDRYVASDHVQAILNHTAPDFLDLCVVNTARVPETLLAKYRSEGAFPVEADSEQIRSLGPAVVEEAIINTDDYVRHDPNRLAKLIVELIEEGPTQPAARRNDL